MPFGFSIPGVPPLLDQYPALPDVSKILSIPNVTSLIGVPSIPALQNIPNITSILNVPSIAAIPSLPGVGNLLQLGSLTALVHVPNITSLLNLSNSIGFLAADAANVLGLFGKPQWGIFLPNSHTPVVIADSVVSLDFDNEWKVSNYPQEEGAFETYNKVSTPYEARVRLSKGGTASERRAFLEAIDAAAGSLTLYDVVMPDKVYLSANIYKYGFVRRATSGVSLLSVDLKLTEVRNTATAQFYNATAQVSPPVSPQAPVASVPSAPSAASAVSAGLVQALPPLPQFAATIQAGLDKARSFAPSIHF